MTVPLPNYDQPTDMPDDPHVDCRHEIERLREQLAALTAELARRDSERTEAERLLECLAHILSCHPITHLRKRATGGYELVVDYGRSITEDTLLAALEAAAGETPNGF